LAAVTTLRTPSQRPTHRAGSVPQIREPREREAAGRRLQPVSRYGIKSVGMSAILAEADVAQRTFYHYFPSKQEVVLAFLQRREPLWTVEWLEAQVTNRAAAPDQRLLAAFEVSNEWFHREDFQRSSFINVLPESAEPGNPVRQASTTHMARIRDFLRGWPKMQGFRSLMTSLASYERVDCRC